MFDERNKIVSKKMLFIGGILNAVFTLFHIWLGWKIQSFAGLPDGYRPLMTMLNFGGILLIGFITFASFFCIEELISTRLGKAVIILTFFVYFSRAIEEVLIAPQFSVLIFISCLIVAAVYALAFAGLKKPVKNKK